MDVGLVLLCSEDMCLTDGETIYRSRTLFEDRLDGVGRGDGVAVDAHVFGYGSVGAQGAAANGRDELF